MRLPEGHGRSPGPEPRNPVNRVWRNSPRSAVSFQQKAPSKLFFQQPAIRPTARTLIRQDFPADVDLISRVALDFPDRMEPLQIRVPRLGIDDPLCRCKAGSWGHAHTRARRGWSGPGHPCGRWASCLALRPRSPTLGVQCSWKRCTPRSRYQPPAAMLNGLHCAKGLAARSALGAWCRNCTNPNTMR
jgi:hypothetical protein